MIPTNLDHRFYYPDAYVIPVNNDTYIIFSQTTSAPVANSNTLAFQLYYSYFSNSDVRLGLEEPIPIT